MSGIANEIIAKCEAIRSQPAEIANVHEVAALVQELAALQSIAFSRLDLFEEKDSFRGKHDGGVSEGKDSVVLEVVSPDCARSGEPCAAPVSAPPVEEVDPHDVGPSRADNLAVDHDDAVEASPVEVEQVELEVEQVELEQVEVEQVAPVAPAEDDDSQLKKKILIRPPGPKARRRPTRNA